MSPAQLNDYLNRGRSPGLDVLERFAGAFGMSLSDLLSGAPVAPQPPATRATLVGEIVAIVASPTLNDDELRSVLRNLRIRAGLDVPGSTKDASATEKKHKAR
jgi:transcriptional regulator with XRE-family HTH domain